MVIAPGCHFSRLPTPPPPPPPQHCLTKSDLVCFGIVFDWLTAVDMLDFCVCVAPKDSGVVLTVNFTFSFFWFFSFN